MTDGGLEFLRKVGAGLDAAVAGRHLPNPALASENPNETDSSAYIRAIRARLIELGYLGEGKRSANRKNESLDPVLAKKIRRFQDEAGIRKDGWAGPVTWRVLECLVSFENQQDPGRWREVWETPADLLSSKAVLRGVYCRLYALGFFDDWDRDRIDTRTVISPTANPRFLAAIRRYCRFARQLGLVPSTCTGLSVDMLSALYAFDKVVAALGTSEKFARVAAQFQVNIEAVARIELWLLGYDVVPGKDRTAWQGAGNDGQGKPRKKISMTRRAIENFCIDNKAAIPGFVQVDHVTPELMAAFAALSAGPERDEPERDIYVGRQLNNTVNDILADDESRQAFENQFRNIASGIFDGIKRVMRWLSRLLRRIVKYTSQFIANIVRGISRNARRYYLDVVKAFDIVYSGLTYLKRSAYRYSKPAGMVFAHDGDFDQVCMIPPGYSPARIRSDVKRYGLRARMYAASLNIISHVMRIAHRVLRSVGSPAGWLLAMLSLSNLANSFRAIRRQVEAIREYELDIAHRQALFATRIS